MAEVVMPEMGTGGAERALDLASGRHFCPPLFGRQGSSVVEQGTHKPLGAGSIPAPGTIESSPAALAGLLPGQTRPWPKLKMAWVYILRGSNGRCYLGSTVDLDRRVAEHRGGKTHSTRRLGGRIELLASRECASLEEARALERELKAWKNHRKVMAFFLASPRHE